VPRSQGISISAWAAIVDVKACDRRIEGESSSNKRAREGGGGGGGRGGSGAAM
jgi:hypothetical protein